MTFSIIASDGGLIGGAVASHSVGVGSRVLWATPGVGIVATQASTRVEYGRELLARLRDGMPVEAAISEATSADSHRASRQVAVMDADGRHAQHSGIRCVGFVSQAHGRRVCAQGNMLVPADIATSMVSAYEQEVVAEDPTDSFVRRLVAGLAAGHDRGGDSRGTRAAGLVVVDRTRVVVDLRVDDHDAPLAELGRLLVESRLQQTIAASQLSFLGIDRSDSDLIAQLGNQSSSSIEREADRWMWLGLQYARAGSSQNAVAALRHALSLRNGVAFSLDRFLERVEAEEPVLQAVHESLAKTREAR